MSKKICKNLIALTENNKTVYHTLRWCGRQKRDFWFTFDTKAIHGEEKNNMTNRFDARSLPKKYKIGAIPIEWIRNAINDNYDFRGIIFE